MRRLSRPVQLALFAVLAAVLVVSFYRAWSRHPKAQGPDFLPFPSSELKYYSLDELAGHVHRPHLVREAEWPEHPQGRYTIRTNNLGFREDAPTTIVKPARTVRILVTGDSHVDGVLGNADSFPNRLEGLLNAAGRSLTYEVINGGTGYYSPENYVGFIKKYLELEPDWFVVVLYTGNDYLGTIQRLVMNQELDLPERPPGYTDKLAAASREADGPVAQFFNQIYFFKAFPTVRATAVTATVASIEDIHELCARAGIRFVLVALPAKPEVEPATDAERLARLYSLLDLGPHDGDVNRDMTDEVLEATRAEGVDQLDLRGEFAGRGEKLFWNSDYHLDTRGHELLASVFYERWGGAILSGEAPR